MVGDRAGHRPEHAERGEGHDVVRELEEDGDRGLEEVHERFCPLGAHVRGRDAEERREDDDLEDVLLRHRVDRVGREEVQERLDERLRLREAGLARRRELEVEARLHDVREDETDDERDRRRDLEVDQGLHAHAPDRLHVARLADPEDDRREDERDDEHLDEADEGLGEELNDS